MNIIRYICLIAFIMPVLALAQQANKTTRTISRLKAEVKHRNNPNDYQVDSTVYFYSFDNAWDDQLKTWRFDSSYSYRALNKAMPVVTLRALQDVGAQVNSTILQQYSSASNSFLNRSKAIYAYQNGKVAEMLNQMYVINTLSWRDRNKVLMYYNSNGQLTDSLELQLNGSNWDSVSHTKYTYGPDGKTSWIFRLKNNPGDWFKVYEASFSYTSGKLTELTFDANYRMRYVYDNNGNNIEIHGEQWNTSTSSWMVVETTYYARDANGNVLTEEYDGTVGGWGHTKSTSMYNSYNQPVHTKYEYWNNGAWQPGNDSTDKYFYYEEVFPSAVKKVNKDFSTVNLYPVPATNSLTIDVVLPHESKLIFSIYMVDGKVLRQWNQPMAGKHYKETISIADLPAGNYILKVTGNKDEASKQFQIIR